MSQNVKILLILLVGMFLISFTTAGISFKEKGWHVIKETGDEKRELKVNPEGLTKFRIDLKDRRSPHVIDTRNVKIRLYEIICGDLDYVEECREVEHNNLLKTNNVDISNGDVLIDVPYNDDYYLDIGEHTLTYSAGTNTITVLGNDTFCNESSPCDFDDIYNADIGGGWGVVTRQGSIQYFINATLIFGNNSETNETWFADEGKQVVFGYGVELEVKNDSHFRTGKVEDAESFSTSDGCSLFMDFDSLNDKIRVDGSLEIYSSTILNSDNSYGMLYLSPDNESEIINLWNVRVTGLGYVYQYGEFNMSAHNWVRGNIENNDRGLSLTTGAFPPDHFHDTVIQHSDFGVRNTWLGYTANESITLRNLWLKDSLTKDFDFYHWGTSGYTADFYVIDGISNWTFGWSACNDTMSKLHRQYSFNLLVQDEAGSPLDNARVRVYDNNSVLLFDEYTNSSGCVDEQIIEYGYYHPDGNDTIVLKSPHTLLVTKSGYNNIDTTWTMNEPVNWILTMVDPCYPNSDYSNASNYPMSWNDAGNILTVWGSDGTDGYTAMGNNESNPIMLENITEFAYYTKGTCIVEKNEEGVFNIKSRLIIGNGTAETYFVSERENVFLYDYFKVKNNSYFRMGTNMNDSNNPKMTPRWGSKWIIDRVTKPDGFSNAYFVENGGSLKVYDSYIGLSDNDLCWDTEAGSSTLFDTSTFGCFDRTDTTYIRFWGDLEYHDLTLHHCRNMNFPNPPTANSSNLYIYSNQNNLQVRDLTSWIFNAILRNSVVCDMKVLSNGNAHIIDTDLNLSKLCRAQSALHIWIRKSFTLKVVDEEGNPLQSVNVTLSNVDGEKANDTYGVRGFSALTDSNGYVNYSRTNAIQIAEPVGTGDPTSGGYNEFYPFTLNLSKEGYQNISHTWNFTDVTNWEITMLNETSSCSYPEIINGTLVLTNQTYVIRSCI